MLACLATFVQPSPGSTGQVSDWNPVGRPDAQQCSTDAMRRVVHTPPQRRFQAIASEVWAQQAIQIPCYHLSIQRCCPGSQKRHKMVHNAMAFKCRKHRRYIVGFAQLLERHNANEMQVPPKKMAGVRCKGGGGREKHAKVHDTRFGIPIPLHNGNNQGSQRPCI